MVLENHHITSKGFLPEKCLTKAPTEFKYLECVLEIIHSFDIEYFRRIVNNLKPKEKIIIEYFNNNPPRSEIEYLYSVLSIIVHKYLWGSYEENINDDKIKEKSIREVRQIVIPKSIGHPWLESANILGIKPALTHGAVDLYNWSLKDNNQPFCLDNLKSNNLMTNSPSEEWFYLIMVAIEGECANSIRLMEEINFLLNNLDENGRVNKIRILNKLQELNVELQKGCKIINRMYERCDPHHFYNVLRIFLGGYSNKEIFPNGLSVDTYQGIIKIDSKGGSAAQSTIVPLWDAFLGIEHVEHGKEFLLEMREYMPKLHRDYLDEFSKNCILKYYIKRNRDVDILEKYKECIDSVTLFRKRHLQIVHDYIVKMKNENNIHGDKGTGGTPLRTFLSGLIGNVKTAGEQLKNYNEKNITMFEWILYKIEDFFGENSKIISLLKTWLWSW